MVLPRERRRSITGENDAIFGGGTLLGVMEEQTATSGYDCGGNNLNCLQKSPEQVPDIYLGKDAVIESELYYFCHFGLDCILSS